MFVSGLSPGDDYMRYHTIPPASQKNINIMEIAANTNAYIDFKQKKVCILNNVALVLMPVVSAVTIVSYFVQIPYIGIIHLVLYALCVSLRLLSNIVTAHNMVGDEQRKCSDLYAVLTPNSAIFNKFFNDTNYIDQNKHTKNILKKMSRNNDIMNGIFMLSMGLIAVSDALLIFEILNLDTITTIMRYITAIVVLLCFTMSFFYNAYASYCYSDPKPLLDAEG
jgi:hypothetical protein